jgi:hypothetical protein
LLNARNFDIATISPIVNSFRHKWKILFLNLYKPIL